VNGAPFLFDPIEIQTDYFKLHKKHCAIAFGSAIADAFSDQGASDERLSQKEISIFVIAFEP
jgi:hypothetical protein